MTKLRGFEPIYVDSILPRRQTAGSAGYDFHASESVTLAAGETRLIGTGVTAYMQQEEALFLFIRSSLPLKLDMILKNSVGVIDSDYYGKEIKVMIKNDSDSTVIIAEGDRIAQGVFMPYLLTDNDNPVTDERSGGFGHTGR